jgi:hypothetical protein
LLLLDRQIQQVGSGSGDPLRAFVIYWNWQLETARILDLYRLYRNSGRRNPLDFQAAAEVKSSG